MNELQTELPGIVKIETTARVGRERRPAIIVWFENQTALRYVWNDDRNEIEEQTYTDGVVHDVFDVGGTREQLSECALETIAEYIESYARDPEACKRDWPHVYEMLTWE